VIPHEYTRLEPGDIATMLCEREWIQEVPVALTRV